MAPFKKVLISLFIVVNLLTMIRVHLPLDTKYFAGLYRPIDSYLSFFSIYQDWMMFAPDPIKFNGYVTAEVEFDDGSSATYDFERENSTNIFAKYSYGEKYRKFIVDTLRKDDGAFARKDAAKFALRKLRSDNFEKIPLKVHLTRHWAETLPPDVKWKPHRNKAENYQSFRFYTYEVI